MKSLLCNSRLIIWFLVKMWFGEFVGAQSWLDFATVLLIKPTQINTAPKLSILYRCGCKYTPITVCIIAISIYTCITKRPSIAIISIIITKFRTLRKASHKIVVSVICSILCWRFWCCLDLVWLFTNLFHS